MRFVADLSDLPAAAEPGAIVGLRGNREPLKWTETTPLSDTDGDGVFQGTVSFEGWEPGEPVSYKFVVQYGAHRDSVIWEFRRYGQFGNRTVALREGAQWAPPAVWNEFDRQQRWERSEMQAIGALVFQIAAAKKAGRTVEDVAREMLDIFGGWKGVESPMQMFLIISNNFAGLQHLEMDVIVMDDDLVQYQTNRPYQLSFPPSGEINGVTYQDIERLFDEYRFLIAGREGFSYKVKTAGDKRLVTISRQEK